MNKNDPKTTFVKGWNNCSHGHFGIFRDCQFGIIRRDDLLENNEEKEINENNRASWKNHHEIRGRFYRQQLVTGWPVFSLWRRFWCVKVFVISQRQIPDGPAVWGTEIAPFNVFTEMSLGVDVTSIPVPGHNVSARPPALSPGVLSNAKLRWGFPDQLREVSESALVGVMVKIVLAHLVVPKNESKGVMRWVSK